MKFVCKFFLDFPIQASQGYPYHEFMNWLVVLESVNLRKNCSKLHERLLLRPKLPTYFDDVTTIENNRQVRVNVDVTLVAIFRIARNCRFKVNFNKDRTISKILVFLFVTIG